jgi:hypothetical protein
MSGEGISDTELMRLFEAARWAPSSYIDSPGDLFMPREIQLTGTDSSI